MGFWEGLWRMALAPLVVLMVVLTTVPLWIWLERRVCARIQQRIGPNRVGVMGLLQPMADAAKLIFKEDITPAHVDRVVYLLAPIIALVPSMAALAVIPFGDLQAADVNIGVLWILALSSLAVYGVVLAGWASNNKWSMMGGIRSAAQMVSYELGMSLAIIAVLLTTSVYAASHGGHALSLRTAVNSQQGVGPLAWNFIWHLPAFVVFIIAAVAESNRAPFDLPEAEQELVAGFHTEYSSFRFAMFYMGEYVHMTTLSAVCTCLFFGGWLSPFAGIPLLARLNVSTVPVLMYLAPLFWFFLKVTLFIFLYIWLRWTLPRMRWDQLMALGWVVLLPAALVWVAVVTVLAGAGKVVDGFVFSGDGWFRLLSLLAVAAAYLIYRRRRGSS
ncbi:MAG: NADH-quinone oxidoreductase subunit NuoH [Armatimonadetes bacterium]|nr:NADH-quinone oxidoreductase subunit NuoH [Armatimonadota bacterium]